MEYRYLYGENGWYLVLTFTAFEKKDDYYFLNTEIATLNPPPLPEGQETYKRHGVLDNNEITRVRIMLYQDKAIGYVEYANGFQSDKFLDKPIVK